MTAAAASLHQPKRALIAAGEVVGIVLLGFVAHWCWQRGISRLEYPFEGGAPLSSTRYHGNWIGTSVGLVTVAAVLLLDAVRQTVLGLRARPRKTTAETDTDPDV